MWRYGLLAMLGVVAMAVAACDGVNGDVTATESGAGTVNGSIHVPAGQHSGAVGTVNGSIRIDDGATVGPARTVNGAMDLESGADVGGGLKNVNGQITLKTAHVGGGLSTVGGDIDLSGESRVEGGILVQEPGGWFGGSSSRARKPRIVIGPGAVVQGNLRFEREVELYVSERATVGPITGATAIRFAGDRPPG
ncbi:MAG: hypothetical protein E6K22_15665 [Gammaproteobacteria bacterium]|nr:MAG: hypothetical protein E6K22_15665 [Gammaproteobacteria bacterium]